jgi:predicted house-cleaning noncanonical NTP pyrophosphatase (MazG superfamily)
MTGPVIFSGDLRPFEWTDTASYKLDYGPKGTMLTVLPRLWTPPFALIPASVFAESAKDGQAIFALDQNSITKIKGLAAQTGRLIVRSSVIGERIWDRGEYESVVIDSAAEDLDPALTNAATKVLSSAQGKPVALVIQTHIDWRARGEFGNLLRVSKTRDHWELSTELGGASSRIRFNTQRDQAASADSPLEFRSRMSRERIFGPVAAWLNSYLLSGRSQRLNCEWITDNNCIYLVQIDEEDEDFLGVNPFHLRVPDIHRTTVSKGKFLAPAVGTSLREWDKLSVLTELSESGFSQKPTLFYVPLSHLFQTDLATTTEQLEKDFRSLIGPNNIIVRTSVRAGSEKLSNLPRTEGCRPDEAVNWCLDICYKFTKEGKNINDLAFVAHQFIPARAAAWVRAEPGKPVVTIHSLWGLPDALQYCPYDIWEVHVPTELATEYADYKSHMLIPRDDGYWEYVRVKNELARSLSIGRRDALDIARRTAAIADRLGIPCHVMWFIGCADQGSVFSFPWYWIEAHDADKNPDRSDYQVFRISDRDDLERFKQTNRQRAKQAIELMPTDLNLMRDMKFIEEVGATANNSRVPLILAGSTLAHAYFALRRQGCTIVARGEKEHTRVRRSAIFGKLVRDKIPTRIVQRQEAETTRKIPGELKKNFLISKLLEEALEARNATTPDQKKSELADLYEVFRALARVEGLAIEDIVAAADDKKAKAGGFDDGLVLLQTGILGPNRASMQDGDSLLTQVLSRRLSGDSYELPFSFFGFMELDQPRSLVFEDLGIRLDVTLKSDRIELHASRDAEQLELSLDRTLGHDDQET